MKKRSYSKELAKENVGEADGIRLIEWMMSYQIKLILRRASDRTEYGILEGASHQDLWLSQYYKKATDLIDRKKS